MVEPPLILQLAPDDHPPFRELCATYEAAGASLGCQVRTVFFRAPHGERLPGASYLDQDDLAATGRVARALEAVVQDETTLALCHRYRSYRVLLASRLKPHRIVALAHDRGMLERWQRRAHRRLFGREVRFAGVAPPLQAELAAVTGEAACLPNALDVARLEAELLPREAALEELGVAETAFNVGVLGRLVRWKRPGLALAAWGELGADDAQLLLLGAGPLAAELEAAAPEGARLLGFRADARRLLKAFDALLLVSEDREAFGMVALEALAAGVPVVTGSAPGPRFVLGDCGIFFEEATPAAVAAALEQARTAVSSGAVEELVSAGRERARLHFSVTALAAHLDDLFFS